jgi:transposase, IS30 family
MRRSYEQLSLEDRCEIARLSANGNSVRQIAAALDRSPSTISRELKRNRGRQIGYRPSYAEQQTRARRWKGSRLERDESLRATVIERLASGWSPEQIAGRLAREQGRKVISYESIYRFIYAQLARTKDYRWRRYLPRGKSKRGCRGRKGGGSQNFIEGRISLAERPPDAADRETPGHWEADLMMFSKYGQAILTVHERKSRLLLAIRLASKAARGVARHLVRLFAALPEALRQTVTFDNGTEFACHLALHGLAIETFFCDPYAPWQKGGIENAIGRMRRFLPRKTDLATLPASRFRRLVAAYNNTPRKCLDFSTPAESFAQLLHFECESTPLLSQGRRERESLRPPRDFHHISRFRIPLVSPRPPGQDLKRGISHAKAHSDLSVGFDFRLCAGRGLPRPDHGRERSAPRCRSAKGHRRSERRISKDRGAARRNAENR